MEDSPPTAVSYFPQIAAFIPKVMPIRLKVDCWKVFERLSVPPVSLAAQLIAEDDQTR